MANRRTDIRRGGIDLNTIVANPSTMIDENGKLVFPDGTLTLDETTLLQALLASIQITASEDGHYTISPQANLGASLGSDTLRFKELYVSENSIYIGDNKLSFENNVLKIYKIETDGTETETSVLSIDEIKTSLISDTSTNNLVEQVLQQVPSGTDGSSIVFKGQVTENPSGSADLTVTANSQTVTFTPATGHAVLNSTSGEIFFYDGADWISGGSIKGSDGATGPSGANGIDGVSPQASEVAAETILQTAVSTILADDQDFQLATKGDPGDTGPAGQDGVPLDILIVPNPSTLASPTHQDAPVGTVAIVGEYYHIASDEYIKNAIYKKVSLYVDSTNTGWEYQYQSLKGDKGDAGADGISPTVTDVATELFNSYAASLKGDDGAEGPQGPAGPQGVAGDTVQWITIASTSVLDSHGSSYPEGTIAIVGDDTYNNLNNTIWKKQTGDGPGFSNGAADNWIYGGQSLKGETGPAGLGINLKGNEATFDDLAQYTSNAASGDAYTITDEEYTLYVWNGTTWVDGGNVQGPRGLQGPAGLDADNNLIASTLATSQTFTDLVSSQSTLISTVVSDLASDQSFQTAVKGDTGPQGPQGIPGTNAIDDTTPSSSSLYSSQKVQTLVDNVQSSIPTVPTAVSSFTNDAGYINSYTVTSSDVIAHQGSLTFTKSQISDLQEISISATSITDGTNTFYQYTHPSLHSINDIDGLQEALDAKVDDSQVLTNVPTGALFTDTTYSIATASTIGLTSNDFTTTLRDKLVGIEDGAQVNEPVTKEQIDALGINASSISGFSVGIDVPSTAVFTDTIYDDTAISSRVDTLEQAGYITDYTVTSQDVIAHQGSLSFTKSQITDFSDYSLPTASATTLGGIRIGAGLAIEQGIVSVASGGVADSVNWSGVQGTPNTISGYGITDAFDGQYSSLEGLPTIPTSTSQLTNDSNFLTSYTETDPVFLASPAGSITATSISNWNTAYSWGDHAQAGYLTSETPETVTSLSLSQNTLSYTDESGVITSIDLSLYLDDTNLARITSGSYDSTTNSLVFERDDNTTFSIDASVFFDDTNLVTSVNGSTGDVVITATSLGLGNVDNTSDLDKPISTATQTELDKKLESADIPTSLSSFTNDPGYITGYTVTSSDVTAHQSAFTITESQISDLQDYLLPADITVTTSSVSKGGVTFEKYTHPSNHAISDVTGLQTALDGKVSTTGYVAYTSSEQSKLNLIEDNATADQSPEEIVNAINGNTTAKANLKTALSLGSAAYTASTIYATADQGSLADSALQSGDNVSSLINDAGYLTQHPTISEAASSVNNTGRTYIRSVTLDDNGHVIGLSSATESFVNTDTTYSNGSGLSLSGTVFDIANTVSATTLNNPAKTVNLSFNEYGLITAGSLQDIEIDISQVDLLQEALDAKQPTLSFGISDNNAVEIDGSPSVAQFAKFTASGITGHTLASSDVGLGNVENQALSTWAGSSSLTTLGTISSGVWEATKIADDYISSAATWNDKQDALTFGIADGNKLQVDGTVATDDYAKFTASGVLGRSTSEVKTDLSLDNVENIALSTWSGSSSITSLGTISSGSWTATPIDDSYISSATDWNAAITDLNTLEALVGGPTLTTDANTVIEAINELETNNNSTQSDLDTLEALVGTTTLATTATTLTNAINEVHTELDNVVSSVGLNSDGTFTAKSHTYYLTSASSVAQEIVFLDARAKANNRLIIEVRDARDGGLLMETDTSGVYMPDTIMLSSHAGPFRIDMASMISNSGDTDYIFFAGKSYQLQDRHFSVDITSGDITFTGKTL